MKIKGLKTFITFIFIFSLILPVFSDNNVNKPDKKILKQVKKIRKKGDKELRKNNFEKAIEYYREALKLYPDDERSNINIAFAYLKLGDYENSFKFYKKSYEINPKFKGVKQTLFQLSIQLGNTYQKENNIKKAYDYFKQSLEYGEFNEKNQNLLLNIYYTLGVDAYTLKKYDEAVLYFKKILEHKDAEKIMPKAYGMTFYLLGLNYSALKDKSQAEKYLKKYIEMKKENPDKWVQFSYYILGRNYYDEMESKIKEIEKKKDYDIKEINEIAKKYMENIEPYLKKAIEMGPLEDAYVNLGNLYYYAGEREKALETYKTLIEKIPSVKAKYEGFITKLETEIEKLKETKKDKSKSN